MVLPEGFVYLNDICPMIREEIFYATKHNFVGEPIDGYKVKNAFNAEVRFKNCFYFKAKRAILTEGAATMLQYAQEELEKQGLGLCIWDAYR